MSKNTLVLDKKPISMGAPKVYRLSENARPVQIDVDGIVVEIERTPIGVVTKVNGEVHITPHAIPAFPPFTVVASVSSPVEGNEIIRAISVVDEEFVRRIVTIASAVRRARMTMGEAYGAPHWGEHQTSCNRLQVESDGTWRYTAFPKHGDYPIESTNVDFAHLLQMINDARTGRHRFFTGEDAQDAWEDDYGDTDGDKEVFLQAFGACEPADAVYESLDEVPGNPPPDRIWSVVEADDKTLRLAPGTFTMNCRGYVVSERPWTHRTHEYLWA